MATTTTTAADIFVEHVLTHNGFSYYAVAVNGDWLKDSEGNGRFVQVSEFEGADEAVDAFYQGKLVDHELHRL